MAQNDFAILVGISRYADSALGRLDGPVRDVQLMHDWLVSSCGGGVPAANVTRIVSDESAPTAAAGRELPPIVQDFLNAFLSLVGKPDRSGYIRREHSRLYLYFSGHGFCEKHQREAHAALYAANASAIMNWNIFGTFFAKWTKDHGLFSEIVLIMDCCRDAELAKVPTDFPLRKPTDLGVAREAKLFELYAAPRGGKAQERPIPARNNEVHGLLTHAFLDAVAHAEPAQQSVSTSAIKRYLEQRWSALCDRDPADAPEIIVPSNGEILFARAADTELRQRFKLQSLGPGGSFEILDHKLDVLGQVNVGDGEARIVWADGRTTTAPIDHGFLVVPLPASYYMAVAATGGGVLKRKFQAGDSDVEL